ncbi:formate hydrogenlyase [uncultured Oscillibacter sp.]|uniref:formate hydrogenlyase n=1 Tax=uncultured Oscillibacter sp. TaxID=876091 RepID=UPI002615DA59|nr:formate hydrogenlyase [uncultured Oscillibacter sp.]
MNHLKNNKLQRRAKCLYALCVCLALTAAMFVMPAFAAPAGGDPLDVVNNLSEFIFSLIRAVGLILLGYGILQVGLSLQSHDPSQRSNGMLTIAGGIVITFTREILNLITGTGA